MVPFQSTWSHTNQPPKMLRLKLDKNPGFSPTIFTSKIPSFEKSAYFVAQTLSFKVWRSSRIMDNMSSPVEKGVGGDFRSQQRTALGKGTRIQRQCNLLITVWEGRDDKSDKCWEGTSSKLLLTAVRGDSFPTDHRWGSTIWQAGLAVLTVLTFLLIEVLNIHHLLLGLLVPQWFMHLYSWNQTVLCPVIGKIHKMMWVRFFTKSSSARQGVHCPHQVTCPRASAVLWWVFAPDTGIQKPTGQKPRQNPAK